MTAKEVRLVDAHTHPVHLTSLELARAAAALNDALDAVGNDLDACNRVSARLPLELSRLADRIQRGQNG
jgi:hypothetical protein